jgi:hypothetical protein
VISARFVPLACPHCSGDLIGRAVDLVAFCEPCQLALRVDGDAVEVLRAVHVTDPPPGGAPEIMLPFWVAGTCAMPAFHSSRPMTLARIGARLLPRWHAQRGYGAPPPVGARIEPDRIARVAKLARVAPPAAGSELALLAVPARRDGNRIAIPRLEGPLYPEDVLETESLVAAVARAVAAPAP